MTGWPRERRCGMTKSKDEPGLSARRDPGLVVEGPSGDVILEESSPARGGGLAVADVSLRWFPFLSWWRFARRMGRELSCGAIRRPTGRR